VNYPALADGASRFIETLTWGIPNTPEAFHHRGGASSPGVFPAFHGESPAIPITVARTSATAQIY